MSSCCGGSGALKHHGRAHVKSCSECANKEGTCCRKPRFCVSQCTQKETCVVCACAKHDVVVAPGVELKLPSVEGATYFWTICSAPYADCSLDCVQGQNCITRSPSLCGLEGATFAADGAYREIKYVGYVVKHDEVLLQKVFRVRVYDVTCQPCDYSITPRTCVIDDACPEITIEYCGSNFGLYDPTTTIETAGVDFTDGTKWFLNGTVQGSVADGTFTVSPVTRNAVTKPCQNLFVVPTEPPLTASRNTHNLVHVRVANLDLVDGRNVLVFQDRTADLSIPFFLVKCPGNAHDD